MPSELMGLGHAFEIDPAMENGFLWELAHAQLARQVFPDAPLKYMPPTKYMTGNVFRGHVQDALFNAVGSITGQHIQLLGMMTEAIHTPFLQDRFLAVQNAQYIFSTMRDLGEEIQFTPGGRIERRAQTVLTEALAMLEEIERIGMTAAIGRGMFADIARQPDGGKGLDGVIERSPAYYNPFPELMLPRASANASAAA
jgi:beta-lysine 5,6-aminomutase alpha subunit